MSPLPHTDSNRIAIPHIDGINIQIPRQTHLWIEIIIVIWADNQSFAEPKAQYDKTFSTNTGGMR